MTGMKFTVTTDCLAGFESGAEVTAAALTKAGFTSRLIEQQVNMGHLTEAPKTTRKRAKPADNEGGA